MSALKVLFIGGTGIITVNQVLATAAVRAGLNVAGLDQTGLSQKAGPVTSHLRFSRTDLEPSNRVTPGTADCIMAFDLLVATDARFIGYGDAGRTVAIASTSPTPPGDMVYDPSLRYPEESLLLERLGAVSRSVVTFDALAAAEALLGGTTAANFLLVGAAHQAGALPLAAEAVEAAIRINGVAVETNIAAFRWGRAAVAARDQFDAAVGKPAAPDSEEHRPPTHLLDGTSLTGETRRVAEVRAEHLVAYQGAGGGPAPRGPTRGERLARRYLRTLETVWRAERRVGEATAFSENVAHGLHRFLAYKDEYEVARLLTDPRLVAKAQAEVPQGERLTYRLHPPLLRAFGMRKKIGLGPATHPVLRALARGRAVRGTPLDPFGYVHVRRVERALRDHYRAMVLALAANLTAASYDTAVAAAAAADLVRGYEDVKLGNVRRYRDALAALDLPAAVPAFPLTDDGALPRRPEARPSVTLRPIDRSRFGVTTRAQPAGEQVASVPDEPQLG